MKKRMMLAATAAMVIASPAGAWAEGYMNGHKGMGKKAMHEKMEMRAANMFERLDANNDGTVSQSEFSEHCMERFSAMDADGDGNLSSEEAVTHHMEMREEMWDKMQERREKMREKRREMLQEQSGQDDTE